MSDVELTLTGLAAGGDAIGRDDSGRVTFVPRGAPGDRVRARVVRETASYARAQLVELIAPGAARVAPPCDAFLRGCGGCQWLHVARDEQLAAKQSIVANALRAHGELRIHPIADPAPPLGWRRRARFHARDGIVGLYQYGSRRIVALDHCPQLEPLLDDALAAISLLSPPDGELELVLAHDGSIAVAVQEAWPVVARILGHGGIAGIVAGDQRFGVPVREVEPGLWLGPRDFAQASAAGNRALVERVVAATGVPGGRLLELYAGAGNLTRGLRERGWSVVPSDTVAPPRAPDGFELGDAAAILRRVEGPFDAIVLDPPRTGAAEAVDGILRHAPRVVVYVSCDPATLARDVADLVAAGYRATDAWPIDLMPQTAHVEVVLRLER